MRPRNEKKSLSFEQLEDRIALSALGDFDSGSDHGAAHAQLGRDGGADHSSLPSELCPDGSVPPCSE